MKVFYSNLKMTADGNLQSEVSNKKITISPSDWMPLAHLQYEGLEVSYPNIPEHLNYDRELALNSMLRPEFQGQGLRNVASLTVDDWLLHYIYVHILRPRSTNFAQLLPEDIFMLWAIKNDNDEDGEEPPQAGDHVQQPAPEGLVPPVPHHGQMFGFQELQKGLNGLRIHIDQRLDNLNMHMDTRLDNL